MEDIKDQQVPTQTNEAINPFANLIPEQSISNFNPFADIMLYGCDTSNDSDDKFVVPQAVEQPYLPLKRSANQMAESDNEDEDTISFPGKPTERSYRTIGLPKPKQQLLL